MIHGFLLTCSNGRQGCREDSFQSGEYSNDSLPQRINTSPFRTFSKY